MIDLKQGQRGESGAESPNGLTNIKNLLSMGDDDSDTAWGAEPARLFAIDTAMLVLRSRWNDLTEVERTELSRCLHDARRLVIDGMSDELGYVQYELERHLTESRVREVWLTALNAFLPSPFRAAEATVQAALTVEEVSTIESFRDLLRERLRARMGEAMLIPEKLSSLSATA